ncbi:MAG: hypothetical protein ACFCD0_03975 [Gemmataceae bacterium]
MNTEFFVWRYLAVCSGWSCLRSGSFCSRSVALTSLACMGVLLGAAFANAGDSKNQSSIPNDPSKLLTWLGSESYRDREKAAEVLENYSKKIIPVLEKGLTNPDPEIRKRCRLLLIEVSKTPEERKIATFIATGKGSPTGWSTFSKAVGDNELTRRIFVQIYYADKNTVTSLAKDSKNAKNLLQQWINKISRRPYPNNNNGNLMETTQGEVGALLYTALIAPPDDRTFQRMYSLFYRPDVRRHFDNRSFLQTMLIKVLKKVPNSTLNISYRIYIARNLGITEELRKFLEPMLIRQIKAAVKNSNKLNELNTIASCASQLGMSEALEKELVPAIEKLAEQAAKNPRDVNTFYRIVSMTNTLKMETTQQKVLKPAFRKILEKQGNTTNRLYQFVAMGRFLDIQEETNVVLRKYFEQRLQQVMLKPTQNDLTRLISDARSIQVPYDVAGYLKPAALEVIYSELAKGANMSRIQSLSYLIQQCNLNDVSQKVILPYVLNRAKTIKFNAANINELQQLYYAAQRLGIQQKVLTEMKPGLTKLLQDLSKKPVNERYPRLLSLIRTLKWKEAIPYVVKVAESSRVYTAYRGQALQYIGRNGSKKDIEKLKPLLKNTSQVGNISINGVRIQTQVRDAALATMVHLSGKTLRDFGFDYAKRFGTGYLNTSYSAYGFANDQNRRATFQKWQEYQEKNAKMKSNKK